MKPFLLLAFVLTTVLVSAQEMPYFDGNLKELQQEAKKKKRPYFVDFYTDWCGYCKKLDATTFKDEEVVKFVKSNFVAYKLNAEKGEGPAFTRKHGVSGFPTIKVFDHNGNEIGTIRGYRDPTRFLEELSKYVQVQTKASDEQVKSYWEVRAPYFESLQSSIATLHPEWQAALDSAFAYGDNRAYFKFDELSIDQEIDYGKEILPHLKLAFARGKGDVEQVKVQVHRLFKEEKLTPQELHYYALYFHQFNDVTLEVLQWINWIALKERESVPILDSKAAIQLAFGDVEDALETAKMAKKIASKNDLDATSIDVILSEAKN